jgi:hypothetical protein
MNRRDLLKTLGLLPLAGMCKAETLPSKVAVEFRDFAGKRYTYHYTRPRGFIDFTGKFYEYDN